MSPWSAPTRCTQPGCGRDAVAQHRCPDHQPPAWNGPRPAERDDPRWARARDRIMRRRPLCAACSLAPATQVDHIIPIADGGALTDPANLQPLCTPCHKDKTRREHRARARVRAAVRVANREAAEQHDTHGPAARARNTITNGTAAAPVTTPTPRDYGPPPF